MNKRIAYLSVLLIAASAVLTSCGKDRNNPGIEYAPEMYTSIPYEPFTQVNDSLSPFKNKMNQQIPPEGTIARGQVGAYDIPNSEDDSIRHSDEVKNMINPLRRTEKTMAEGEVLYARFCGACHGAKGEGKGKVAQHDAINPQPYNAAPYAEYTAGEVYYVIMHGKGVMGSYASQLEHEDRWKVIHYIEMLQGKEMPLEKEYFDSESIDASKLKVDDAFALKDIEYGSGDATIGASGMKTLKMVENFLKTNDNLVVQFEGHTDTDGDSTANQILSEQRAQAVADYMVAQGVPTGRVKSAGFGPTMPVARGEGTEFKSRNRRTEIKITDIRE